MCAENFLRRSSSSACLLLFTVALMKSRSWKTEARRAVLSELAYNTRHSRGDVFAGLAVFM